MSNKGFMLALCAVLLASLPSCIPSKSEVKPAEPEPKITESVPAKTEKKAETKTSEETDDPHVSTSQIEIPQETAIDENDDAAITKKMDQLMGQYDGVKMSTAPDGIGFNVEGPHGLKATLKPDTANGKWVFDGEFLLKAEGFKVGEAKVTGVSDGIPFAGQEVSLIPGVLMVAIPVVLPDINALETGDEYRTPIHFTMEAAPTAQFIVNVMPVGSL